MATCYVKHRYKGDQYIYKHSAFAELRKFVPFFTTNKDIFLIPKQQERPVEYYHRVSKIQIKIYFVSSVKCLAFASFGANGARQLFISGSQSLWFWTN